MYKLIIYLHKSFTFELMQVVGSTVQAFPLGVQDRISHVPPGLTVQQQGQAHHTGHGYQHCIYCQIPRVHLKKQRDTTLNFSTNVNPDFSMFILKKCKFL